AIVYSFAVPSTVTSRVTGAAKVTGSDSAVVAVWVAPAVAWVTSKVWVPVVRPGPAARLEKPRTSAPFATSTGPEATICDVDATVPVEAMEPDRASCWTVNDNAPALAAVVAVAVTLVEDDVAAIAFQSVTLVSPLAALARLENSVLSCW